MPLTSIAVLLPSTCFSVENVPLEMKWNVIWKYFTKKAVSKKWVWYTSSVFPLKAKKKKEKKLIKK